MNNNDIQGSLSVSQGTTIGGNLAVRGASTFDHNVKIKGWIDAKNIKGPLKGLFESENELKLAYPEPQPGWFALVGNTLPAEVYRVENGEWADTGQQGGDIFLSLDSIEEDINKARSDILELQETISEDVLAKVNITDLDFDRSMIVKIISGSNSCKFVVMANSKNVGILHCFSDDSQHMLTQVFTTHNVAPFSGGYMHTDAKIYQYFRSYHLRGGTSTIPTGTWGEWKLIFSSDINTETVKLGEEDSSSVPVAPEVTADYANKSLKDRDGNDLRKAMYISGVLEYEEFSTSKEYAVGDVVSYMNKAYKFIAPHSAGAWDESQVEETSMKKELQQAIEENVLDESSIKSIQGAESSIKSIQGAESLEDLIVEETPPEAGVGEEGYLARVEIPVKRNSGYIGKLGQISTSSLAYYSDFIPVLKDEEYEAICYTTGAVSTITSYSDKNDDNVVDVNVPSVSNNTATATYKIPDGVKFIRYSTYTADKSNNKNGLYAINSIYATGIIEKLSPSYNEGTIGVNGQVTSDNNSLYANISVVAKDVYLIKSKFKSSNYVAFFNSSNDLIAIAKCAYSDSTAQEEVYIQAPADAVSMKFSVSNDGTAEITHIEVRKDDDTEEPVETDGVIVRLLKNHDERINKLKDNSGGTVVQSENDSYHSCLQELGFIPRPNIEADYCFIPFYGQSFTVNTDGGKVTDYDFDENTFMFGNSPIGVGTTDINHLSASNDYIVSSFADTLSRLLKLYSKKQNIIAQSYGIGGKKILALSKGESGEGLYESNFMAGLTNAKSAVDAIDKTIACPFILYLQGESDLNDTTKEDYKSRFKQLIEDMQSDVMSILGQTVKPIIITYTPGNVVFKSKFNEIQQAILEVAKERDDVYCVGPYYYMPTVSTGHLTPDGRRWLAEMLAKYTFQLSYRGVNNSISIDTCKKVGNTVSITFNVPNPPLIVNNIFQQIYYEEQPKNYGFNAYKDSSAGKNEVDILSLEISGNTIKLSFADDVNMDSLVITYANWNSSGVGYISDSAKWISYNTYMKEQGTHTVATNDKGESLVGKKYPMQSWLPQFCINMKDYIE